MKDFSKYWTLFWIVLNGICASATEVTQSPLASRISCAAAFSDVLIENPNLNLSDRVWAQLEQKNVFLPVEPFQSEGDTYVKLVGPEADLVQSFVNELKSIVQADFLRLPQEKMRDLQNQKQGEVDPYERHKAYYRYFTAKSVSQDQKLFRPRGTSLDTKVLVTMPNINHRTLWDVLSEKGRRLLVHEVANLYRLGTYERREGGTTPPEKDYGYRPNLLLGAASLGRNCGECRLASAATGSVLVELGIPVGNIREVIEEWRDDKGNLIFHIALELQLSNDGVWWHIDSTAGGPDYIPPHRGRRPEPKPEYVIYRWKTDVEK